MKVFLITLFLPLSLLIGCESDRNPFTPADIVETGKIEASETGNISINVTWPQDVAGKKAGTLGWIDTITAYLYLAGEQVTREDLDHVGSRGVAEISVMAVSGYRLEIVAFYTLIDDKYVQYTGFEDNITVPVNDTVTVTISMCDAVPVLSYTLTDATTYKLTWTSVPLATSYFLEESLTQDFIEYDFMNPIKLSSTLYTGINTTISFTDKPSGIYYYAVFVNTPYSMIDGEAKFYNPSPAGTVDYDFYCMLEYGDLCNILRVVTGTSGVVEIDIPWPTDY